MDAAGIAAYLVGAQQQNTRMQVATAVIKQQQSQDQALLNILDGALASGAAAQAAPPPGTGLSVDITV
ncbi:hypothetical protein [Oharaeibacter diazotrophicus]|uniref:Uncharacterized protein n=1 Tax=Oharaeibacter diazotrophicus TaxID=1920512 RepID=A0A4R6RD56_9HYPH|nr:hypothetical protein [Oharaeibacter diazotrophicus]TDP84062.1 hypothetical protein EDD54_2665 [Oharaeibacter diazotrophicus]BBE73101.1 hypothetical protein OHA_1_02707 [Pleomorphomonas sp. SM30]GLS74890.1 hypothetical protein GCM10007904_02250 [Oharaeibacter diazotrophicus]